MEAQELKLKIENKIQRLVSNFGYSRKKAESVVEKALKLVTEGKKSIFDVIDL